MAFLPLKTPDLARITGEIHIAASILFFSTHFRQILYEISLSNSSIAPDPPTNTIASKLSMSNSLINISVKTSPPNLPIALFSLDTDLILFPCFSNTSFVIKYSSSLKSLEARIIAILVLIFFFFFFNNCPVEDV